MLSSSERGVTVARPAETKRTRCRLLPLTDGANAAGHRDQSGRTSVYVGQDQPPLMASCISTPSRPFNRRRDEWSSHR